MLFMSCNDDGREIQDLGNSTVNIYPSNVLEKKYTNTLIDRNVQLTESDTNFKTSNPTLSKKNPDTLKLILPVRLNARNNGNTPSESKINYSIKPKNPGLKSRSNNFKIGLNSDDATRANVIEHNYNRVREDSISSKKI